MFIRSVRPRYGSRAFTLSLSKGSRGMTVLGRVADGNAVGYPRRIDQVGSTFQVGSTWMRRAMTKLGCCRLPFL